MWVNLKGYDINDVCRDSIHLYILTNEVQQFADCIYVRNIRLKQKVNTFK